MIVLHGLRGEIEVAGRTYRGYMPPMRHLPDEDIAAIIGFVLASWSERQSQIDADQVGRLRTGQPQTPIDGREDLMRRIQTWADEIQTERGQP